MPHSKKAPLAACALLAAGMLAGGPASVSASEIAMSDLTFSNFNITPNTGSFDLLLNFWEIEAYAEARNSLGEIDQNDQVSFDGGTVSAGAAVTWASSGAAAVSPSTLPPTLDVAGSVLSNVVVPGEPKCKPEKWAYAEGTATLINGFALTGGTGSVPVSFSVDLDGSKRVETDNCDVAAAWTELIFSFEIFGLDELVLFHRNRLECSGPNCAKSELIDLTLTATETLEFDVPYFFALQVDSESRAEVPLPPTALLLLAALPLLARRRNREPRMTNP